MMLLIANGLMPQEAVERKALENLDPYTLRSKALEKELSPYQIGRALFHIDQRRGFKSNRKTEKGDKESGAIKEASGKLQSAMEISGAATLGQFLAGRHGVDGLETRQEAIRAELKRLGKDHLTGDKRKKAWAKARKSLFGEMTIDDSPQSVRARNNATGPKAEYDFYPTREMLEDEFDKIWAAQARHHSSIMTEAARTAIYHVIFFQRPLKIPPVGKCSLDPAQSADDADGFRCSWADPRAQRFRIWQEVRNLEIVEAGKRSDKLKKEDGDKIALALMQNTNYSFDKIRSLLKLPQEAKFNLESDKRDKLLGDETSGKLSHKSIFGKGWRSLTLERQIEIVDRLLNEADHEALVAWLIADAGLNEKAAERAANAFLPDGHCRLGLRAIMKITPHMIKGMDKWNAEVAAGYHTIDKAPDKPLNFLPYYGERLQDDVVGTGEPGDPDEKRWGRVPNPTVHIGLGQIRRVVNALIREFGPPAEVNVEMTRDFKLSPKKLAEVEAEQAENQRKNNVRREELRKLRQAENPRNLMKLRLWEELNPKDPLDRCCPFTGEKISIQRLFSDEVEIEHLIPYSESLDDSAANKVVCMRYANRAKGNMTPFEAFGSSPVIAGYKYDWQMISAHAASLQQNKRRRFSPDAREHFGTEARFLARQLNETGWLARMAKDYLSCVTNPNKVLVLPGKLTALIRRKWRLNDLLTDHNFSDEKNRKDHRHHTIDAVVAALTDRSLLLQMASAYDEEREHIEVPLPWKSFCSDLDALLKAMVVSYKAEHGVSGQLHEDTAYGAVKNAESESGNLVYRKPLEALKETEISRIRDPKLRSLVKEHIGAEMAQGKDIKQALGSFNTLIKTPQSKHGVRHVRLTKAEKPEYLVPVPRVNPNKYYSAGENAYVDIVETQDGKWNGFPTNVYKANQRGTETIPTNLIMRVFKGDLLAIDTDKGRKIYVVHRLDAAAGRFKLALDFEAGNLNARHADPDDPFRWLMASYNTLKSLKAEKIRVNELGRVWRERPEDIVRKLSRRIG